MALLCLLLPAASMATAAAPDKRELIRVPVPKHTDIHRFALKGLDIWAAETHSALVYATDADMEWLTRSGFQFISQDHLADAARAPRAADGYLTLAEYEDAMTSWAAAYPDIVQLSSIGQTVEGRDIWMLKISDNAAVDEDEPVVLMISLQHCREWLSGMTLHGITEHLITSYGTDTTVTALVDSMEIHVILVANPDGYHYTHTTDRFWRKNRRNNGDGSFGVDLNRNWPYAWTNTDTTSSNTWGGPAPLSEPETTAVQQFLLSRDVHGLLNYHTYGTRVMHNWAHTFTLPPNADVMGDLAYTMSEHIESVNGQSMRNGSWSICLEYAGAGATNDYVHATLGIPTLTLELRPVSEDSAGFAPPGTTIAPSVSENIAGALYYLQWVLSHAADPTSPTLSALQVVKVSNTEATIRWKTDDPATRIVQYGTTPAYGTTAEPDRLRSINHEVRLTGLSPGTLYHFRAGSQNLAGLESWSPGTTFTTTASAMDITPPQYPPIRVIRRSAPGQVQIIWNRLAGGALAGFRLYESPDNINWTRIRDETTLLPASTSVVIPAPPAGEYRSYRLAEVDNATYRNESIPSDGYAVRAGAAATRILVVDGFDQWGNMSISQGLNHDFTAWHGKSISEAGFDFDTCANQTLGAEVSLASYEAVVWVLGTESSSLETFSNSEQAMVQAFLEGGGKLFVTGADIGRDLDSLGSTADRSFYNNYLSADYVANRFNPYSLVGAGGAGILGIMPLKFDDGSRRIYRVSSADRITPLGGGVLNLRTAAFEGAGIQREGVFGAGTIPGKVVMLSVPFETIWPEQSRHDVMAAVMQYFGMHHPASITDWQDHMDK